MSDTPAVHPVVITSINPMTSAVRAFAARSGWQVTLVSDRKSPAQPVVAGVTTLDLATQQALDFATARVCPENHYARKNLGYLAAIRAGATCLAESDDDNFPLEDWGQKLSFTPSEIRHLGGARFCNVYREFSDEVIWPRGYPLAWIQRAHQVEETHGPAEIGVWQELADNHPDVDAIFRLTRPEQIAFQPGERFVLDRGVYCPFNSQNTFWQPKAFAALYLPSTVTMRYCDILRSYVAQRLLWAADLSLGFGPATVRQERNEHDLMRDFREELTMYSEIEQVVNTLEAWTPRGSMAEMLVGAYAALAEAGLVAHEEVTRAEAWARDIAGLQMSV